MSRVAKKGDPRGTIPGDVIHASAMDAKPERNRISSPSLPEPEIWSASQVRAYLGGVSQMWLHRRLDPRDASYDPNFPKPFSLGAMTGRGPRRYWRRSAVEAWLQRRAIAA
jgi:predicted DNA-binding transcriptional regulator AlpA